MKNLVLMIALSVASMAQASTLSEPIPGTGGESYICINQYKQIKTDGYVHFVFTSDLSRGDVVEIRDYANDYAVISAEVVSKTKKGFVLSTEDGSFVLAVNTQKNEGNLNNEKYEDYKIGCSLSGPVMLE